MDWITTIIAVYGAGLATVLGISEWRKGKRTLTIILEYMPFYEKVGVRIVNSGTRPVTIINIVLNNQHIFGIEGERGPFPLLIEDGAQAFIPLDDDGAPLIYSHFANVKLEVIDAERNVHKKFKILEVNPRFGGSVYPIKPDKNKE